MVLTVYSHWLSLGPGQGLRLRQIVHLVLYRTFHTASEQGQERKGNVPIFQVLKLFHMVCFNMSMPFRSLVLAPDTATVKSFCLILVPDTASVITP